MVDEKVIMNKLAELETHFVLVHGIGSGGWSWFKIRALLEEAGCKVSCPDLKSAGIDPTDVNSIHTLEEYDQPLIDLLSTSENERIILVGHSAGGISLTHMIHKFPKKIHTAVFVAATMLRNGFLTDSDCKDGLPDCSELTEFMITEKAFHMCSRQDKTLASSLQKPGPMLALQNAKFEADEGVDEVRRVYVKTKQDLLLTPEQQDAMVKKWLPASSTTLDSDHCPHLSKPCELFHTLIIIAAKGIIT
ncbi:hypothetical protein IFM89_002553 [Coptis chinensis]|uniref:AB hydrolase-1 domain-containing protein n=1 Tax=Coptis chinensis TaxID=261450 RepID=A0A835HGA1_9MAGN|nr:hypothetical protein IFM89_002553 [Coptis chinensis]